MLTKHSISSLAIRGERQIWVQPSDGESADCCCVFLDAELYLERVMAADIIEGLIGDGQIPPVTCVYLSYGEPDDRHLDFICNPAFSNFLAEELLPWVEKAVGPHRKIFLCGLSLSGLATIFAACNYPSQFSGVLAQSPSAWWKEEWLAANLPPAGYETLRIATSVGTDETQENVTHAPTLFQRTSQIDSCRRLAERLKCIAKNLRYIEYVGGHDSAAWAAELPQTLIWLLND